MIESPAEVLQPTSPVARAEAVHTRNTARGTAVITMKSTIAPTHRGSVLYRTVQTFVISDSRSGITLSTDSTHRAEKSTPGPPQRSEVTIMRPGGMSRPVGMIHGFRVVPISDVDDHACRCGSLRLPQCSRKPLSHKQRDWPSLLVKRTKVLYPPLRRPPFRTGVNSFRQSFREKILERFW